MEGSSLFYGTNLQGLVAIGIVVVEIERFWLITGPNVTMHSKGCVA